ncbi:hypothetical protein I7X12_16465 [Halosimplex litoreum]|uniref:Uncharacterized protein n=1 Tax=Halosimplex litoreum TaxID=1198301 RepID=A0A7T3FX36_9EURY|nr:hypothetical protein [Halosimplex litoreum]QPV62315.1 hypothetical protein I7X12_16465 [Halosimplex litoreum]
MSRIPRPGPTAIRVLGVVVAVGSLALLLSYPYHMRYHYSVPAIGDHYIVPFLGVFLAFAWAAAVAWGAATALRGRIRSLTPPLAWIAVPLAPLPAALDTYHQPTTDVAPAPPRIAEWTPPAGPVEVAVRVFEVNGFWRLGCVLFLAMGVARARGQRRWLYGTAAALVWYGGAHGIVTSGLLHGALVRSFVAAVPGVALFVLGAKLAAPEGDEPDPENTDGAVAASS